MGLAVSLILVAAGAILAWGVTDEPEGLNLDAVGAILIVIGIIGFVLSLLLWRSWWGPGYFTRESYVEGGAPARPWYQGGWQRRRTTYVEDEPPPPPGGPPPPP